MLSRIKLIKAFPHMDCRRNVSLHKPNSQIFNSLHVLLNNNLCTLTESTENINDSESPELPGWVKFSDNENPSVADLDDDHFIIPSIADWAKNQKFENSSTLVKNMMNETVDSDVEKISKILKNRYSSADDAARALRDCGVANASESLVVQLLRRFSNDWIPAFGVFKWAKMQTGCEDSKNVYDYMIDILGKSKKFGLMWELIGEMEQLGEGYVTLGTMSKVMRRFSRAGKWNDAIEAFRNLDKFEVKRDTEAMNILIDALVKENSVEHGMQVFLEFKDDIPPNAQTFNVLIHGWCKARKLEEARNLLKEMEEHGFKPDVVSYSCFVEAYCREKDYRKVDEILDEMQEKGCPPNVVTYTIYMHSLGKSKEIRQALEVYERMKQKGCVPDTAFYSSLIFILGKSGRLKDAQDIFEDMLKQGVNPSPLTYSTMISLACHNSKEEDALKLLLKMEENSCKPDLKTYAPLLKMCCTKKRMKVLAFLLNHMLKNDLSLEVGTYSLLVHGLCRSGKLEHACLFFEEMALKGFTPKDCTYQLLIKHLEAKSMVRAKEQIETLMLQAKEKQSSNRCSNDRVHQEQSQ